MEETLIQIAEEIETKRYGKYRGIVADNKDPDHRGRLKLRIPSVLNNDKTDWAMPCLPFGGYEKMGFFMIPEIGSQVWVEFEEGDINSPIWTGTFWQQETDVPPEVKKDEPTTRLLQTRSGHFLQFEDEKNNEKIRLFHKADAELMMDSQGRISIKDASGNALALDAEMNEITIEDCNGNRVVMNSRGTSVEDASGNRIEMNMGGITIDSTRIVVRGDYVALGGEGGEPIIKGQSFLSLFAMHRHTVAPIVGGPTSPPIPQGELSTLSSKVTTS